MNHENPPLRVAIIGCGRIARAHAQAIAGTPGTRLSAVCDSHPQAAEALASECGVTAFSDAAALLAGTNPAIAVLCTPPATHAPLATLCLQAGAHVLCEKPLGLNEAEATQMYTAAKRAGRALMMAAKFRFMPAARALKARIEAGELGELLFCRVTFFAPVEMAGRMNANPALSGGGVVMDNGPHAFDLAQFLLGPLGDARGQWLPPVQHLEVEDGATLQFSAPGRPRLRGEIALSWSAPAATQHFVEVCGTHGGASLSWSEYDKTAAFAALMAHFAGVARGECAPEITEDEALRTARLIDEVYRGVLSRPAPWTRTPAPVIPSLRGI